MILSVVIIAKNEAHIIGQTLQALHGLTDDIVVVDSGSTDATIALCEAAGARVIRTTWMGYGSTKNLGVQAAKNDWILSLDADEVVDEALYRVLQQLPDEQTETVYTLRFKNFFCGKWLRFGEWGTDKHIRVFNRLRVTWNDAAVHESLLLPAGAIEKTLPGFIHHYTAHSIDQYIQKTIQYARLNADKYKDRGKKTSWVKLYFAPFFTFIHNYIIRLGFLDGYEGYLTAKTTAWYTFLKYAYLKNAQRQQSTGTQTS
jgi:glycosyltransferase involved in cell wall biosynthesis